jgi:hypothetical protein
MSYKQYNPSPCNIEMVLMPLNLAEFAILLIILVDKSVLLLQVYYLHRELLVWYILPFQPAQMNPENLMYEDVIHFIAASDQ